jgi:putative DNA primase/helicase
VNNNLSTEEYEKKYGIKWVVPLTASILEEKLNWNSVAKEFIDNNPLWYDRAQLWWSWSHTKKIYEQIDETDLLIMIDQAVRRNNLRSNVKAEILEAFKRAARKKNPQEPPKTWVQFGKEIYDCLTGEKIEPRSSYFMTNAIPYSVGESEETPNIDLLLSSWGGEYALTLKQLIAYCCLRDYPLHRIFLLIGSGSNGKGTYLRLLNKFIGTENVASTEMDLLISNQFHITKLHKKLCCQMSETNFQALKNTSMLKRLSGGDLVGYEYKNKLPFDDYNYAKIIIATNSLPVTHDKTDGFYRRWIIVDFKNQFSEKTDPLINISDSELSSLSRWCLNAIRSLLTNREFDKEGSIADRKERYESRSNPLQAFLEENYDKDANEMVEASDFYDHLSSWLQNRGHRVLTYQVVRNMMKEEGYEYDRNRLGRYDNPVAVLVGLKRIVRVSAVSAVSALSTLPPPIENEPIVGDTADTVDTNTETFKQWLKVLSFIKSNTEDNAWQIEEVIGIDTVKNWLNEGKIMENPKGTYRLL